MARPIHIYALADPRTGEVRYVGSSVDPARRLYAHMNSAQRLPTLLPSRFLGPWLAELIRLDTEPEMVILETVDESEAKAAEERWIEAHGGVLGRLLNARSYAARGRPLKPPPDVPTEPAVDSVRQSGEGALDGAPSRRPQLSPETLIDFRQRHGLSQAQLAKRLMVHYSTVSLWESGKHPIPGRVGLALKAIDSEGE